MSMITILPSAKKNGSKAPTTASRKKLAADNEAMPGGRYPTPNVDYLQRAIKSIGRTPPDKRAAVVAWIKKSAKRLGRTDLVTNLSNELKAIELAGAASGEGDVLPYGKTRKQSLKSKMPAVKKGSGASKLSPQESVKAGGLKTHKGKAIYSSLKNKGFPENLAMKAAKKHEQGLLISEMSNAGGPKFGSPAWDAKYSVKRFNKGGGKTAAKPVAGSKLSSFGQKLGLNSSKALNTYSKARQKGVPHPVALKFAKRVDDGHDASPKKTTKLSNSPKVK